MSSSQVTPDACSYTTSFTEHFLSALQNYLFCASFQHNCTEICTFFIFSAFFFLKSLHNSFFCLTFAPANQK